VPTHTEQRILPYTPDQLFDLVSDIESYPKFLPWCTDARILKNTGDHILAELTIGYKMLRERFVSNVHLNRETRTISVTYVSGPLKALKNEWSFEPKGKKKTCVHFFVHFEFSNPIMAAMMNMFFNVAFVQMVSSFEKRAARIYGAPPKAR
jgi:coenzyme Q-binding protein COQ10